MCRVEAPSGETRVVQIDLFNPGAHLIDDYVDQDEAFRVTDSLNKTRTNSLDKIYRSYNDKGQKIHGNADFQSCYFQPHQHL